VRDAESRFANSTQGAGDRRVAGRGSSRGRRLLVAVAVLVAHLALASAASASTGVVGSFPFRTPGHFPFEAGANDADAPVIFSRPSAAAVNADGTAGAAPGDIYVIDRGGWGYTKPGGGSGTFGPRIQQFTARDNFVRLWGPDVVFSGPDNADEVQAVRVDATGGTFKLSFGADVTTDVSATATAAQLQAALDALPSIGAGGVSVGGGPGNAGGTSPYIVTFDGFSLAGKNQPQLIASNGATPLSGGAAGTSVYTVNPGATGFEICQPEIGDACKTADTSIATSRYGGFLQEPLGIAVNQTSGDQASGDLYVNDLNRVNQFSATGHFLRAWGRDVVAAGPDDSSADEQQQVMVKADGGSFTLGFTPGFPVAEKTTAPIPWNAPASGAGSVAVALNALKTISGNQSFVTVTGGPGDHEGSSPYIITFHGLLGGDNVPQITSSATSLSRTGGGQGAAVTTLVGGGSAEICTLRDSCQDGDLDADGAPGGFSGRFGTLQGGIAVAPTGTPNAGNVLVADASGGNNRIEEFTASGDFVRAFGWDVVAPGEPGNVNVNEVQTVSLKDVTGERFSLYLEGNENGQISGIHGFGTLTNGSNVVTSVQAVGPQIGFPANTGTFAVGQTVSGAGIPAGTTIAAVGANTLTLSQPATKSGNFKSIWVYDIDSGATAAQFQAALEAFPPIGSGNVSVSGSAGGPWQVEFIGALAGLDVPQLSVSPPGRSFLPELIGSQTIVIEGATGGTFRLTTCGVICPTTGNLSRNATAAQVQTALEGLPAFGAGNVSVSGPAGGPWQVTMVGALAGTLQENLVGEPNLVGDEPSMKILPPAVVTNTLTPGAGFEVCVAGESCQAGTSGPNTGQFTESLSSLAEDSSGAIYAEMNSGVQKFTPAGGLDLTPSIFGTNEVQSVTVNAAAGQFHLSLPKPGGTTGTGTLAEGSTTIENVVTNTGAFVVGQPIQGGNIPYGTYITAIGPGTMSISRPRQFFSGSASFTSTSRHNTVDLPYNVPASGGVGPAASLQNALNDLFPIRTGGGSVTVSGGPGGTAPYTVTFDGGPLVRTDPPELIGSDGTTPLSGGSDPGANTVSVQTTIPGGPKGTGKVLGAGLGDHVFVSRSYTSGATPCTEGRFSAPEVRVQELDPSGAVVATSEGCDGIPPERGVSGTVNPATGRPYLLDQGEQSGLIPSTLYVFGPFTPSPDLTLDASLSDVGPTGATITGTIDPNGPGEDYPDVSGHPSSYSTTYRVEYKKSSDSNWTKYIPDIPIGGGTSPLPFSVGIAGLAPKTAYDLKVVAVKPLIANGTVEATKSFTTTGAPPAIGSFNSSGVTATSADLHAQINPQGTDTTYHFEYGTGIDYGSSTSVVDIGESLDPQTVAAHIEGLADATYHFRVVATNSFGTTRTEDQTFDFHPPSCPNQTVRQQTNASYLPDCRAYELVSPENAGGTTLFTGGPQRPYATSPSRLAFVGGFGQIPNSGDHSPIDNVGDLYVATRGPNGWTTKYIGLSSDEVGCMGGRPQKNPFGVATSIQNDVFATPDLGRLIDWNLGSPATCIGGEFPSSGRPGDINTAAVGSNAPYLWSAAGDELDRWPTAAGDVPGAAEDLACPQAKLNIAVSYFCKTHVSASGDLSHFVFSTQEDIYNGGHDALSTAPGSAYDNNTADNTLSLISIKPGGGPITQEPGAVAGPSELIQFPHVSTDGSRILMGTTVKPPCRQERPDDGERVIPGEVPCPLVEQPTHLYMRVDDAVSYDVSEDYNHVGRPVTYVGSTDDGSKVFFTTAKQMTADDADHSVDLYMWDENGGTPQLTRLSAGAGGTGNTDNCVATWTTACDVKTYDDSGMSTAVGNEGGLGGYSELDPNPGYTDNSIAAQSGAIYFYSPEQLVAGKGVPTRQNVYLYRDGALHFVAALSDDPYCVATDFEFQFLYVIGPRCSKGSLGRFQVTPDGRYAAFLTTTRLTPYDNAGYGEMYRYNADTEQLLCVSCNPSGNPATANVLGSMGGRFITDDGRVFFDTEEALVPRDSNQGKDTYEFVDGRPQLITSGTGGSKAQIGFQEVSVPGFYGVSADGTDAYFGTLDTLVGQDHNGSGQLKFYDARVGGGFPFNPPAPPCAAADECHGPSSQPPAGLAGGTGAALSGGNHPAAKRKHRKHRRHRHRRARGSRTAHHTAGGAR
jgi:hypothetical protein